MKKATLLPFTVLVALVLSLDFSESAGDFFSILDQETAEYLAKDGTVKLHRSSSGAVPAPRNNKYLEASMQIIRGKIVQTEISCTPLRFVFRNEFFKHFALR